LPNQGISQFGYKASRINQEKNKNGGLGKDCFLQAFSMETNNFENNYQKMHGVSIFIYISVGYVIIFPLLWK
jgi:hypothetical protein